MPKVSSADAATLAAIQLVESLKHHFTTINDTYHTALIKLEELFNIITKVAYQQSTNRHNGQWCEVEKELEQGCDQVTYR